MAKRLYHLYAVNPKDIGERERYYLITPAWTLLYTNRKPPEKNREIKDLSALPPVALEWLNDTINRMRGEYLRSNERELLRRGKEFTDRFEAELRAEKEKLEQKRVTDDAG